jgi:hypothetical protein
VLFRSRNKASIRFETLKTDKTVPNLPYPEYPMPTKVYNSMLDIKRKLHLFTETENSKCYHAAGWFAIKQNGVKEVVKFPKYIFIQRYPYLGPFKTESEAIAVLNTL